MVESVLFAEKKKKKKKKQQQQQQRKKKSLGLAEEEEEEKESKRYRKPLVEIDVNNPKGRYSPHPGGVGREFGG